jgi:hypothetical protein
VLGDQGTVGRRSVAVKTLGYFGERGRFEGIGGRSAVLGLGFSERSIVASAEVGKIWAPIHTSMHEKGPDLAGASARVSPAEPRAEEMRDEKAYERVQ